MARRIEFSDAAMADLHQLTIYGALEFGRAAARDYGDAIFSAAETLAQFPFAGPAVPNSSDRSFVVRNHRLIYRSSNETLSILRILHVRQLPPGLD